MYNKRNKMANVKDLEVEIVELRKLLRGKEELLAKLKLEGRETLQKNDDFFKTGIPKWAVERYSRQLLVTELGPPVQCIERLLRGSVLVVGAGGLGCPAAGYLAGAGVGHIGVVDYDEVELTNIHRQLLHSESSVGMSKVDSAASSIRRINSNVRVTPYNLQLDSSNALDIIRRYDVVLDATDNVVTRYLLNDACVLTGKPLVTASALKMEGQLTIYNHFDSNSPSSGVCMRCVFPTPPPPAAVGSCSQQGVLGPIPGVMGTLQAVETVKLIVGAPTISGCMLIYDGMDCSFRRVKLRGKNPKCSVCSPVPTITHLIDYTVFCNAQASDKDLKLNILSENRRILPKDFYENAYKDINKNIATDEFGQGDYKSNKMISKELLSECRGILLIDVRSRGEFDMCNISGSVNIPIDQIEGANGDVAKIMSEAQVKEVYFLCRRGNDSQIAAKELMDAFAKLCPTEKAPIIKDIVGGLHQWSRDVDSNFPIY